jgi:hypothetical protein
MTYTGKESLDDEGENDLEFPAKPPGPSPFERREEFVRQGDFAGLYQAILQTPWHATNLGEAFGQLFRAIDAASRKDPVGFSDELFQAMLATSSYAMVRVQYMLLDRIGDFDRQTHGRAPEIPRDVLTELLQHLHLMQGHVAEILQARATTARLWQLARQKRLENDRAEQKEFGANGTPTSPTKPSRTTKNGQGQGEETDFQNRIAAVSSN